MEERLRLEEVERQKSEQEWRVKEASEAQAPRVPDSYATYRAGPRKPNYGSGDDGNSCFVLGPTQSSGFAEFSGAFVLVVMYLSFSLFIRLYLRSFFQYSNNFQRWYLSVAASLFLLGNAHWFHCLLPSSPRDGLSSELDTAYMKMHY